MKKYINRIVATLVVLIAVSVANIAGSPAVAAEPGATSDSALQTLKAPDQALPPDVVRDLVARLDDQQVRDILIQRLDVAEKSRKEADGADLGEAVDRIQSRADQIRSRLSAMFLATAELPGAFPTAIERLQDGRPARFFLYMVLGFALMIVVGLVAERLFNWGVSGFRQKVVDAHPEGMFARFCYLVARFGVDIAAILVFLAAAIGTFFVMYQGHVVTRRTFMSYLAAIAAVKIYATISRFLLAPKASGLRLANMTDSQAGYLHRQNIVIACIASFGFFTCSIFEMLGVTGAVHHLMTTLVFAAMIGWIIWAYLSGREGISADIRGPSEDISKARRVFAEAWPRIASIFVFLFFVVVETISLAGVKVGYYAGFGSLIVVLFVPHLDAIIERAARRTQGLAAEDNSLGIQLQAVILRATRIVLFIGSVLFLARIWGVDFLSLAQASVGAKIAGALLDIGLTALVAYVLWEITRIAIDRRLAQEAPSEAVAEAGDMGGSGKSRLSTVLPLLKRAIQVTIAVIAVMVFLSAMGVNIGPLLAGAGVVGLAVGFGAQTLVRDVVSGVFFLMDDAFRVGEYIDVGSVKGTVEKISIRSLRLRHHKGALHTIPFGEIRHLTNHSRDWVIMKLDFRVPFDTDINTVRKIFKQIGLELLEHPDLGPDFIQPFKSQGVYTTDDSALVIRGKFMAHPGRQFLIRREVFTAVQKAFAENGISFASRQVTVNVPDGVELSEEQKKSAEAAAASVAAAPAPGGAQTPAAASASGSGP